MAGLMWPRAGAPEVSPLLAQTAERSALPDGRRCPFDWPATRIAPGAALRVVWADTPCAAGAALLRVTVALDDREEKVVDVRTAASGTPLGCLDVRCAGPETPGTIVARVRRALGYLPPGRLSLNPDCGFAPSGVNPIPLDEPYAKLKALADAARQLR